MTPLEQAKIRVFTRACITRYGLGERSMNEVVAYYNQPEEITDLIKAEIIKTIPNIVFEATTPALS